MDTSGAKGFAVMAISVAVGVILAGVLLTLWNRYAPSGAPASPLGA